MTAVSTDHLLSLYRDTDDPWNFRTSPYEAGKFDATLAALPRPRFAHVLELGCGNGELARRIAPCADSYTGLDAVPRALEAARRAVPDGRFFEALLPCPLPEPGKADYDLVLLSEILYFLDPPGIAALAAVLDAEAPGAECLAVTWTGPSGNAVEGPEAVALFTRATRRATRLVRETPGYRIDHIGRVLP